MAKGCPSERHWQKGEEPRAMRCEGRGQPALHTFRLKEPGEPAPYSGAGGCSYCWKVLSPESAKSDLLLRAGAVRYWCWTLVRAARKAGHFFVVKEELTD